MATRVAVRQLPLASGLSRRTSLWGRLRFQLVGEISFGILVPLLAWLWVAPDAILNAAALQALGGSVVALLIGTWQYRTFGQYPGVRGTLHVLSSFSAAFAVVIAFFFFTRLEYVRPIFFGSYVCTLMWWLFVDIMIRRHRHLRIGFVPFGSTRSLHPVEGVTWAPIDVTSVDLRAYDAIVADFASDLPGEWERAVAEWALAGLPIYSRKHLLESLTGQVEIEHLSENQFGTLVPASSYLKVKATLDWLAAAAALPVLLPLMLLVGFLIRLETPGPAIYRQTRMGFRGRPFTVYKFRTMRSGPVPIEDMRLASITATNDRRITPLGRFLRNARIDELPQILNILRGEMSWIGPRPEAIALSEWYESELPFYRYRHIVRPGISGWAQVNQGHVADLQSIRTKLYHDFYYVKYFSPSLDLLIVVRTLKTMLTGFGAK